MNLSHAIYSEPNNFFSSTNSETIAEPEAEPKTPFPSQDRHSRANNGEAMDSSDRVKSPDPFLAQYQPSELMTASEFLMTWMPFLSRDLCENCTDKLSQRVRSLVPEAVGSGGDAGPSNLDTKQTVDTSNLGSVNLDDNSDANSVISSKDGADSNSLGSWKDGASSWIDPMPESSFEHPTTRVSWADMVQEDELEGEEEERESSSSKRMVDRNASTGEFRVDKVVDNDKPKLSRDQREHIRFRNVKRKKDFICIERVTGKLVNILEGLELHTGIFSAAEQKRIVDRVYALQELGKKGELKERTYTAPQKWMRGKGRVTLQFGCCYNYAVDKNGNPPGILHHETVDPIPDLFKVIIRRLVRWHVLPPTCVPDSCIVNIYEEGDCIPPHIDNHDFVRPFCTVSFLSECNILFGSNLRIVGPGEFSGSFAIPLPVGSVLVLNGNGADVAKHCVPAVPTKRISITFRRMDDTKRPLGYTPEPDLQGLEPLAYEAENSRHSSPKSDPQTRRKPVRRDEPLSFEAEKFRHSSPQSDPHPRRQPIRRDVKTEGRGILGSYEHQQPRFSSHNRRAPPNKRRPRLDLDT